MSGANRFIGSWEIILTVPRLSSGEGIEGTIFHLSKTGDVTWEIPEDAVPIPLFSCETYEVVIRGFLKLRFGAYKGHVLDFTIQMEVPGVQFTMNGESSYIMYCRKVDSTHTEDLIELPFSLLPALEDSYFSDLSIAASNNREFLVHTCILKLNAPDIDWTVKPTPLSGLPEEVIGTILHFLYAQCLPPDLHESVAKQVIVSAPNYPGLEPLVSMCQSYIKNITLKREIISLISDMHSCASRIVDYFSNKDAKNLMSNPVKLCYALKSSIREAAVACSKMMLLCELYNKKKDEISLDGGHEIIRYGKSRIPVFMSQIQRFFQGVKSTFSSSLTSQKQELACYLVPETEAILDAVAPFLLKVKSLLATMLAELEADSGCHVEYETLEQRMDKVLYLKSLVRLRFLCHRINYILLHLQRTKESFKAMTSGNKIRSVARNLERLIERLPFFLLRLEEVADDLDEKLEWNESQFCFKVGTSIVSELIKNLLAHKEALQDLLVELCELVQRDSFSQSLVALGLLDPSLSAGSNTPENLKTNKKSQWTPKQHGYTFNLTEFLCVSPPPHRNHLSKAAMHLLRTGQETDMVFEVITNKDQDSDENSTESDSKPETDVLRIEAHRVIIAARCDWFRRALLSGMQEDINRKIQVHNTSPTLFSLFLEYLYSGRLDYSSLSVEQISELLLLSDRYEVDSLKQACENELKSHLDIESVVYFFSMADQSNAKILKSACIQYIAQNLNVVISSESFKELPDNLQTEIYDLVKWDKLIYRSSEKGYCQSQYRVADIEQMVSNVHLNRSGNEELPLTQDSARLEAAIERLRDIVDTNTSRSQLVRFILAADYDIVRAASYYFTSLLPSHRKH